MVKPTPVVECRNKMREKKATHQGWAPEEVTPSGNFDTGL